MSKKKKKKKKNKIKSLNDILNLNEKEVSEIKEYNTNFSNFLLESTLKEKINFYFTSSRSYSIPKSNIVIGALKAYPTSIYFNANSAKKLSNEIRNAINLYEKNTNKKYTIRGIKDEMVYK